MELPSILMTAVEQFCALPGVGEKTALRQVLGMTNWKVEDLIRFADSVKELTGLSKCIKCGMFADGDFCKVCLSPFRAECGILCVVESITDCLAIERSGEYKGKYHVLGGVLNPLLGIGPEELNINKLVSRVKEEGISEVILAVNPSVEGDATCSYLLQVLPSTVTAQRIGFGIPVGGSLEYLDSMTITKALENKRKM